MHRQNIAEIPLPAGSPPINAAQMIQNALNPIPEHHPEDFFNPEVEEAISNPPLPPPGPSYPEEIPSHPGAAPRRGPPEYKKEYGNIIPQFNGEPLILAKYIKQCDKIYSKFYDNVNPNNFQNDVVLGAFTAKLGPGIADKIYLQSIDTYLDLRKALVQTFSDKRDTYTLTIELSKLRQQGQEDCFNFYDRVSNLLNAQVAYLQMKVPGDGGQYLIQYMKGMALRVFVHGIMEPYSSLLRTKAPANLGSALSMLTNDFNLRPGARVTPPFQMRPTPSALPIRADHNPNRFLPRHTSNQNYRPYISNQVRPNVPQNFIPRNFSNVQRSNFPQPYYQRNAPNQNQQQNSTQKPGNPQPQGNNTWVPRVKTEPGQNKGPTPMSISTRNTNFNMMDPSNQYTDQSLESENAQYFDTQAFPNYETESEQYEYYENDVDQLTNQFENTVSIEQDPFLGNPGLQGSSTC